MNKDIGIAVRLKAEMFDDPSTVDQAIEAATQLFERRLRAQVDTYLAGESR